MKNNCQIDETALAEIRANASKCGIDENLAALLYIRGIKTFDEVDRFLYPSLSDLHSPFLMNGISEAVCRIRDAISKKEKIAVFADSDLDGITSLAIIYDVLKKCYEAPLIRYIRDEEGYGLTCDIIDEFLGSGVSLLITVDSGIRDIEEINYARCNGIDVIVTDHHEPDEMLPACVVINPKCNNCSYPFDSLAGVGVAFKLAHGLLLSFTSGYNKTFALISGDGNKLSIRKVCNGIFSEAIIVEPDGVDSSKLKELISDDHIILGFNIKQEHKDFIKVTFCNNDINTLGGLARFTTGLDCNDDTELAENLRKFFDIKSNCSYEDLFLKVFLEIELRSYPKIFERLEYYLSLVAIGTIADVMPLVGENRTLTKLGLKSYREGRGHSGISLLLNNEEPSSKRISWSIAPLLNAPGRFGQTSLTVDFFLAQESDELFSLIKEIEQINNERKRMITSFTDKLKNKIDSGEPATFENIYFYMDDEVTSGIAGLLANRIADIIKKPVIVAAKDRASGHIKGSGRSYNDFDFFRFVEPFSSMFEKIGGHAQAFGFTVKEERLQEIISAIDKAIIFEASDKKIKIDMVIDIDDINSDFIDSLSLLEPFGKANEEPVFMAKAVEIDSFSAFGNGEKHGRFILKNGLHAIGWKLYERMQEYYCASDTLDLIFTLENNVYMNRTYPRLILIDMDTSGD